MIFETETVKIDGLQEKEDIKKHIEDVIEDIEIPETKPKKTKKEKPKIKIEIPEPKIEPIKVIKIEPTIIEKPQNIQKSHKRNVRSVNFDVGKTINFVGLGLGLYLILC